MIKNELIAIVARYNGASIFYLWNINIMYLLIFYYVYVRISSHGTPIRIKWMCCVRGPGPPISPIRFSPGSMR